MIRILVIVLALSHGMTMTKSTIANDDCEATKAILTQYYFAHGVDVERADPQPGDYKTGPEHYNVISAQGVCLGFDMEQRNAEM